MSDLDLSPREVLDAPRSRGRALPMIVLAVVVGVLGFVLFKSLGDAALFFYNVDEAIEQRDDLGDERFRLQGTPVDVPVEVEVNGEPAGLFSIAFEDFRADIVLTGTPVELVQPGVPVVLEGRWVGGHPEGVDAFADGANDGYHFASSDLVVKHDNEYRTSNEDRLREAEAGGRSPGIE